MSSWCPPLTIFWMSITPAAAAVNAPDGNADRRLCVLQSHRLERIGLALGDAVHGETLDRLVEQAIEIQLRAQVQEHGAKPDRGAIHEHEFARHRHRAFLLERLMHAKRFAAAVFRGLYAV